MGACNTFSNMKSLNLDSIRESLIRQEDTIIFSLIERSQFPMNSPVYTPALASTLPSSKSLLHFIVNQSETIQSQAGRYESPEEHPFFPDNLPSSLLPQYNHPQAISRRIHYGKFVAEVKYLDAPEDYAPAIRAQDRDALMKLLTFESVEEMLKRRVEKKAKVFAQEVSLNVVDQKEKYKIDPSLLPLLYGEWIMPLTKLVEVEYLLKRLD
uniref:chorismate mutase n=1 Tax=Daucus carota subsp. sativus TaxID=79200 RepID=A0A164V3Z3_DAUCS